MLSFLSYQFNTSQSKEFSHSAICTEDHKSKKNKQTVAMPVHRNGRARAFSIELMYATDDEVDRVRNMQLIFHYVAFKVVKAEGYGWSLKGVMYTKNPRSLSAVRKYMPQATIEVVDGCLVKAYRNYTSGIEEFGIKPMNDQERRDYWNNRKAFDPTCSCGNRQCKKPHANDCITCECV